MTGAARALLLGCAAVVLGSCGGTPTSPTFTTDTFTGTLQPQGKDFHDFTVSADGYYVDVSITSLTPNVVIGPGLGTDSSGSCVLGVSNESVATGSTLQFGLDHGTYCVEVHDVGNLTSPVTYTVQVYHP